MYCKIRDLILGGYRELEQATSKDQVVAEENFAVVNLCAEKFRQDVNGQPQSFGNEVTGQCAR